LDVIRCYREVFQCTSRASINSKRERQQPIIDVGLALRLYAWAWKVSRDHFAFFLFGQVIMGLEKRRHSFLHQ
jgi:hypothetical protein